MSRSQGVCNQPLVLLPLTRTPRVNWLSILGEGRRPPRGSNWGTLVTVKSSSRPGRARARLLRNLHDYLSVISNTQAVSTGGRGGARGRHGGRPAHYPPGHRVNASPPPSTRVSGAAECGVCVCHSVSVRRSFCPHVPQWPVRHMQLPITAIRTTVHAPSLCLSTSNVFVRSLRLGAWGVSFSQPV